MRKPYLFIFGIGLVASAAIGAGNQYNDDFRIAKKILENNVYADHRVTLYCEARFDKKKNIELPSGFRTPGFEKRARRVEWEHVVPAENFGRHFKAWREGYPACVKPNGKRFKGRQCADLVDATYRYMQADMHNLFPAIGAVNAVRSNYRYMQFAKGTPSTFGSCKMIVDEQARAAEPPDNAKGVVARASLYMAEVYAEFYQISDSQRKLFEAWNKTFPVTPWECKRAKRIFVIQGNTNSYVEEGCKRVGIW